MTAGVGRSSDFRGIRKPSIIDTLLAPHDYRVELLGKEFIYHCGKCHDAFGKRRAFITHFKTFHKPKYIKCRDAACELVFATNKTANNHYIRIHTPEIHICPTEKCGIRFSLIYDLIAHQRTSHNSIIPLNWTGSARLPVSCANKECTKRFISHLDADDHWDKVHRIKEFACDYLKCNASFDAKKKFLRHLKKAHNLDRRQALEEMNKRQRTAPPQQYIANIEEEAPLYEQLASKMPASDSESALKLAR